MAHFHPSAKARHKQTLPERIDAAVEAAGGSIAFEALANVLYPDPKSHVYQSNGGPPGCYMALSAGLRRGGFPVSYDRDNRRRVGRRSKA